MLLCRFHGPTNTHFRCFVECYCRNYHLRNLNANMYIFFKDLITTEKIGKVEGKLQSVNENTIIRLIQQAKNQVYCLSILRVSHDG